MEDALGIEVSGQLRNLRRLIYCGEWIESHCLHLYMLHAPDFLGYESGFAMARDHRDVVERGLRAKKAGNRLIETVGGRAVHPINVRVGGFYKMPERRELEPLRAELERCRAEALETVRWVAGLDFPELERDYELVSLRSPVEGEYPIDRGRIVSSKGIDIAPAEFDETFEEEHVAHSTALHARVRGRGAYLAGPMARFDLNRERLSPLAAEAAREAGIGEGCRNPFRSIVVRAVEILYAFDEALRLIDAYERPDSPAVEFEPRAAIGHGVSEAPRGLLYHRYEIDDAGEIASAWIVPPTSQNQRSIEEDLREFVAANVSLPDDELRHRCEQTIRNYDPCISCSTHFLRLEVERE
jgi:coenzyme F420-reducing hydrogenase alpha subunit